MSANEPLPQTGQCMWGKDKNPSCMGFTFRFVDVVTENPMFKYFCDDCIKVISNRIDQGLKANKRRKGGR